MTTPHETRRLDELAQEIAPTRDLWPAIAAQIESRAPVRARRPFTPWLSWAVTAGLAVVSGLWWLQRQGGGLVEPEVAALDAENPSLAVERRRLSGDLPAMLDALPLEARVGAQQSLRAVRGAREEIVAAIRRDTNDVALRDWLRDNQQQEVRVMQAIVDAGLQTRAL